MSTSKAQKTSDIAAATPGGGGQAQNPPGPANSTQKDQGQAYKQFGSTQRLLFAKTGKRAAGDALEDSNAPAAKRVCDAVRGNMPGNQLKDEFDDEIDLVWLDAATHLANAVEANERSKNAGAMLKGRIKGQSATASRAIAPKRAIDPKTPTRNHQPQHQPTSTQTTGIPQYLSRMAAAAQSVGSAAFGRAVAKPRPTPSQHAMPPPPPRQQQQQQKTFTGKPLVAWTPPATPAGKARAPKAPGCSQFEPIVLD